MPPGRTPVVVLASGEAALSRHTQSQPNYFGQATKPRLGPRPERRIYEEKDTEVDSETQAARQLINAIIDDANTPSDNAALARVDTLRDELDEKIDAARTDMVKASYGAIATIRSE